MHKFTVNSQSFRTQHHARRNQGFKEHRHFQAENYSYYS